MSASVLPGVFVAVWLEQGLLKQMVLVITEADTKDVLERWTFDIDTNKDVVAGKGYKHLTCLYHSSLVQVNVLFCLSEACSLSTQNQILSSLVSICVQATARQERQRDHTRDPSNHAPGKRAVT